MLLPCCDTSIVVQLNYRAYLAETYAGISPLIRPNISTPLQKHTGKLSRFYSRAAPFFALTFNRGSIVICPLTPTRIRQYPRTNQR